MKVFVFIFSNGESWEDKDGCTVVVCAPDKDAAEKEAREEAEEVYGTRAVIESCSELQNVTYQNEDMAENKSGCLFFCCH